MIAPGLISTPPAYFNFATDVVDEWARKKPDLAAMQWVNGENQNALTLSYSHFSEKSHKVARLLVKLGAKRGDRLMIVLNRTPAWWEIATGAIRAGLVVCPCTTLATAKDIEFRVQTSAASILVGNNTTLRKFLGLKSSCSSVQTIIQADGDALPGVIQYQTEIESIEGAAFSGPKTKATDPVMIYFTSGTTGPPKMVLHNQVSYPLAHRLTGIHWLRLEEGKLYWTLAEQGWAKAAWSWFATWNTGATLFIQDSTKPFSPSAMLKTLHNHPITTLCAPPTAYRQLVTPKMQDYFNKNPPRALEHCVGAGEPLNADVIRIWHEMSGIDIRDGYGQTETICVAGNWGDMEVKRGSMGRPLPGVPLHVIDEDGRIIHDHREGDMAVKTIDEHGKRTIFTCDGYLSKDGIVTRKSRPSLDQNGNPEGEWHLTGDRAYQDEDGYLWFIGRSDDVISSSGYRIGPFEVESALKSHPAVVESAVIGIPDPDRGEIVKAFVVLNQEFRERDEAVLKKELQDHCKREAAPYKYPRQLQFVSPEWLPKTTSGKIRRAEIRQWEKKAANSGSKL